MPTSTARQNLIGIVCLCAGSLVFSLQDSVIKSISGTEAVTLAIVFRAIVSMPILLAMVAWEGKGSLKALYDRQIPLMLLRGLFLLISYTSYFMAFPALPLAEAVALYFMVPLVVIVISGPMLGEYAGWKSWCAVLLGLVGVFIILQPGTALFKPAALLSLVSAFAYSFGQLLARKFGARSPVTVMVFYQNWVYLLGASAIAGGVHMLGLKPFGNPSIDFLLREWNWPTWHVAGLMAICGVIAALGSTFLANAYRIGQANVVAPFEYTGMFWAIVFGFAFFGEVPTSTTVLGMLLISGAGVLALLAGRKT
ncbi:DMT family transporter [Aestuariivirga litoralis]|uniref:DMT family transporter n=1 Tax=Aestuariivirga litoralis TaxID=2650924 RepID=UPI0018C56259|nr:DMT family transporter [Aestuariivirga litoralis]MBG1232066.1 DMT family transporter [Aestuariivirga litoralis]